MSDIGLPDLPDRCGSPAPAGGSGCVRRPGTGFRTARLILRDVIVEDAEAVHVWARDPDVCRYQAWGPNTPDQTRSCVAAQIAELSSAGRSVWTKMVVRADIDLVIGSIEVRMLSSLHRQGEFGYVFRRDHWGRGYATEAARAMLAFGFAGLGMERISATCDPDNLASARVLTKAGLRYEGRMRHHQNIRGRWRDSLLFAVVAGDDRSE